MNATADSYRRQTGGSSLVSSSLVVPLLTVVSRGGFLVGCNGDGHASSVTVAVESVDGSQVFAIVLNFAK